MRVIFILVWIGLFTIGSSVGAKNLEVTIDPGGVTPKALKSIHSAVEVIMRQAKDQDGGEADRLRRRARDATRAALEAEGYFSAQVNLQTGLDNKGETWDISIQPGQRCVVSSVDLKFTGRIISPEFAARIHTLREAWQLHVGKAFVNANWNKAKSDLFMSVSSKGFLLARMTKSEAIVDAKNAQVHLEVVIDSGPLVKMGELKIEGLKRVPAELIKRYVRYRPGEVYDQDKLNQWQQDLQSTYFFRGAFVSVNRPVEKNESTSNLNSKKSLRDEDDITLPVQARLVEAPARRISSAMGFDDTAGVRFETLYRQNVLLHQPLTMENGIGLDRLRQRFYTDFYLPPDQKGRKDSIGVVAEHSNIEGQEVTRFALGVARLLERRAEGENRVDYETRWGLLAAHDRTRLGDNQPFNLPTLTLTTEWLRRDVDKKYDPREGNLLAVGGGVGINIKNKQPYSRLRLRAQEWWPIGKRDVLTLRGELGKVWAKSDVFLPDDFGFRTGGARSIRGYRYQSIGINKDQAVIGAPTLAVASLEYDHYFNSQYGMGVFVDAGDAAASFKDMKIALAYGIGGRLRTLAGPLFLDLAYAQRTHEVRIHFSLGIAF